MADQSTQPGALAAASTFLAKHGFTTVAACVFLWLIVYKLPPIVEAKFDAQTAAVATLARTLDAHSIATTQRAGISQEFERQMLQLAWLTCRNTARTKSATDACDAVWR